MLCSHTLLPLNFEFNKSHNKTHIMHLHLLLGAKDCCLSDVNFTVCEKCTLARQLTCSAFVFSSLTALIKSNIWMAAWQRQGGKQNEKMNRYIEVRHQDERLGEVKNTSQTVAAARLCSGSASFLPLSHTHTHKSQAGLSLHDRAKLLWLNTQEYRMIKVSGAF